MFRGGLSRVEESIGAVYRCAAMRGTGPRRRCERIRSGLRSAAIVPKCSRHVRSVPSSAHGRKAQGPDLSRQPVPAPPAVPARRRPARGDRQAVRRPRRRPRLPDAARRHRLRQDLHDGERDRAPRPAGARPRAEQDARGAAVLRVPRVLPRERGRVLRLVLRLLPARGLRPVARSLHREGLEHQRAHRADAALGDEVAARARGRGDRRHRVVHLRHRRPGRLPRHDPAPARAREGVPARRHRAPGRDAVRAQRARLPARHLPRARRRDRRLPGGALGNGGPVDAVRRRGRQSRCCSIR